MLLSRKFTFLQDLNLIYFFNQLFIKDDLEFSGIVPKVFVTRQKMLIYLDLKFNLLFPGTSTPIRERLVDDDWKCWLKMFDWRMSLVDSNVRPDLDLELNLGTVFEINNNFFDGDWKMFKFKFTLKWECFYQFICSRCRLWQLL